MPAFTVATAGPRERQTALELLFADLPAAERREHVHNLLADHARGEVSLDGLLLARRDGEPVGAAFYMLQPGGAAFVWPPAVRAVPGADEIADALLQDVLRQLDAGGVTLAQSLIESHQADARAVLERNGCPHATDLVYLQRVLDEPLPPRAEWRPEIVTFDPGRNADHFAALLERTYIGSLDCPTLRGKRRGVDALESHRASGEFDPARWRIYRVDGSDVGVLLLADHPEHDAWEVAYVGVVPEARGRGYGRAMLVDGLHTAREAGRGAMLLAVDSGNRHARRVYDALGFQAVAVRAVHLRVRCSLPVEEL